MTTSKPVAARKSAASKPAPRRPAAAQKAQAMPMVKDNGASVAAWALPGELQSDFFRLSETMFGGWVLDAAEPERRISVEVWCDGVCLQVVRADHFTPELRDRFGGDGCHGFLCDLAGAALPHSGILTAYVANTTTLIGNATISASDDTPSERADIPGAVRWSGGLRLTGWAYDRLSPDKRLRVFAYRGNECIGEALADAVYEPERDEVVPTGPFGFDMMLPLAIANSEMHEIRVLDERGTELGGSPLVVAALSPGLAELTGPFERGPDFERRAGFFQLLFPSSMPLGSFAAWKQSYPLPPMEQDISCRFAILVFGPQQDVARTVASIEASTMDGWLVMGIDDASPLSQQDWRAIREDIAAEKMERVVFLRAGDRIHPEALSRLAEAHAGKAADQEKLTAPEQEHVQVAGIVYTDAEIRKADGVLIPALKPAFDLERARSQGYMHGLVSCDVALLASLPEDMPLTLPALVAGVTAAALRLQRSILHLPQVLVTLQDRHPANDVAAMADAAALLDDSCLHSGARQDKRAQIEWGYGRLYPALRLRPALDAGQHVTVIIPTRDRADLLRACMASLEAMTDWPAYDVIVVDNDSREPEALAYLDELERNGTTILRHPGPFNYSRLNNAAARVARGSHLLLLNNDTECIENGWMTAMLEAAHSPDTGAVGANLLWPSGMVQHGGVVLGPYFGAVHAFNDCLSSDTAYDDLLCVSHEVSAVTAACLMVRREDYWAVGGLDEKLFPVNFNDVDLCLKLRALGRRNIWTPHATLLHKESASRKADLGEERKGRANRELRALRLKWGHVLLDDPYYSPSLNLDAYPYSALAWPPRKRIARSNTAPVARASHFAG